MPTFDQRKSRRQEKRAAADLGGRVQPASGAMSHAKGDVRTVGSVLAECKTTSKKSYNLKLAEWQKVQSEARGGEMPVMQVEFQGQFGMHTKLAVISWADFLSMRETETI
jgi:hypothetical protein